MGLSWVLQGMGSDSQLNFLLLGNPAELELLTVF